MYNLPGLRFFFGASESLSLFLRSSKGLLGPHLRNFQNRPMPGRPSVLGRFGLKPRLHNFLEGSCNRRGLTVDTRGPRDDDELFAFFFLSFFSFFGFSFKASQDGSIFERKHCSHCDTPGSLPARAPLQQAEPVALLALLLEGPQGAPSPLALGEAPEPSNSLQFGLQRRSAAQAHKSPGEPSPSPYQNQIQ